MDGAICGFRAGSIVVGGVDEMLSRAKPRSQIPVISPASPGHVATWLGLSRQRLSDRRLLDVHLLDATILYFLQAHVEVSSIL